MTKTEMAICAMYASAVFTTATALGWYNHEAYLYTALCMIVTSCTCTMLRAVELQEDTRLGWITACGLMVICVDQIVEIYLKQTDSHVRASFLGFISVGSSLFTIHAARGMRNSQQ